MRSCMGSIGFGGFVVFASLACSNSNVGTQPDRPAPGPDIAVDAAPGDVGPSDTNDVAPPQDLASSDAPSPDMASMDTTPDATSRCTSDRDCVGSPLGAACDTTSGRCVRCTATNDTCPAVEHCNPATFTCAPGCRSDEGCRVDGGPSLRCDTTRHACVACLTAADCPLGMICEAGACRAGCEPDRGCGASQTCCARVCVDTASDPMHCGACGRACMLPSATAACRMGACAVERCAEGRGDCDGMANNGCEADVASDVRNCGACGRVCAATNASPTCVAGRCGCGACLPGFADCDSDCANGCETDTRGDARNCGACGRTCALANADAACRAGACAIAACREGFADCDMNPANGCEVDVRRDPMNCGACGARGVETCNERDDDCDGVVDEGCCRTRATVASLAALNANARSVLDIAFDDRGNTYLIQLISGRDDWVIVPPTGMPTTTLTGISNWDMGYGAVSPDGAHAYVTFTNDPNPGLGRRQDNTFVRAAEGARSEGIAHNGFPLGGPGGIAFGPDGRFYVGNLQVRGQLHRFAPGATITPELVLMAPARIHSIDCDGERTCYLAVGNDVRSVDVRAPTPVLTLYESFPSVVRSVAVDRSSGEVFIESGGAVWRRAIGASARAMFHAVSADGMLEVGPDCALYRVRGVVDGTSEVQRFPLR